MSPTRTQISQRLLTLFTFCPPGPLDRENCTRTADAGTRTDPNSISADGNVGGWVSSGT
jgi:hypothetical protein